MASKIPAKIGKYDVTGILGRGGMGVVYKATDPFLDRLVAIKMMTSGYADNPELLKRFFREAQATGNLQHANIVTVYELGDHDGNPYLVMEFLEGESLDSIITSHKQLTLLEKINFIIEVCQGLGYAHQRGIVHRDIKPANLMVSMEGKVKIVDFGIAHLGDKSVTRTGQIMGSISYMAPEQLNGNAVDPRTDIFATGVVLYQLITYTAPFDGENTASTLLKILHEPPPPLKNFLSGYPQALDAILLKALAKSRDERYFSADDFALDLVQLQGQLRHKLVSKQLEEAAVLIEKADLYKARDQLLQVLKIDRQSTQANLLLREVQQRIQREEISQQVRQLRAQAEEALAQEQFEVALGHVDRALALDRSNEGLHQLRESIDAARSRARKLQEIVKRVESAYQQGDFDYAKQAVEEALDLAPDHAHVRTLHRTIQHEWEERARLRQVENFLDQARREISLRNFTPALEILDQAAALDPEAPQIKVLIESARAGRELERRRRELEAVSRQIEEALNRDDYLTACRTAEQAVERFPEERTLLKLKSLAEKQRQVAERKEFVDEQLANAHALLEQGRGEELLELLEATLKKTGPEPRLESLLLIVHENVQRQRTEGRKTDYLQRAKEALRQKAYDQAIEILQAARRELNDASEILDLLQFAKEEALAEIHRQTVEAAAREANDLIARQDYERAIALLETTLEEVPDEELRIILAGARRTSVEYHKKLESTIRTAEKLLQARKAGDALRLLDSHTPLFGRNPAFQKVFETTRVEAERLRKIDKVISQAVQALAKQDYAAARSLLEEGRRLHGSTPELEQHFEEIGQKQSLAAAKDIQKNLGDAHILVMASQYQAALDKLVSASDLLALASPALKAEYEVLRQHASDGLARQRIAQIERCLNAGEFNQADALLRQSLLQFPANRDLLALEDVLREETKQRLEAQQTMAAGLELLNKNEWEAGARLLKQVFANAQRTPALREQVLTEFVRAAHAALETNWHVSEALLGQLAELQPEYTQPPGLQSEISQRRRQESVKQCLEQAKRFQSANDLQGALREVARGIAEHRDQPALLELRKEIQEQIYREEERVLAERARQEKEAFLQNVAERAQRQPELDQRIRILEEGLAKHPKQPLLLQFLKEARELSERVTAIVEEAGALENAKKYTAAIQQWNVLRSVHAPYPHLESNIARLTKLNEQARAAAQAAWAQRVQTALDSADYDSATHLLTRAQQEFPESRELSELNKKLQDVRKLRAKAQKIIADGHAALSKRQWRKAADCLTRAWDVAGADPVIREQVVGELLEGCQAAIDVDCQAAEMLLAQAAGLQPASPLLGPLSNRIQNQKREQNIERYLTSAVRTQSGGDLEGAVRELDRGLSQYPEEPRLTQVKKELESRLRQREEERQGEAEEERARQLAGERQLQIERKREQEPEREKARAEEQERKVKRARKREEQRARQQEQQKLAEKERLLEAEKRAEEAPPKAEGPPAAQEARPAPEDLRQTTFPVMSAAKGRPPSDASVAAASSPTGISASVRVETGPKLTRDSISARLSRLSTDAATFTKPLREGTRLRLEAVQEYVSKNARTLVIGFGLLVIAPLVIRLLRTQLVPVEITTVPSGATIRIKNTNQTCVTPKCSLKLRPGRYEIETYLQGYETKTQAVTVSAKGPNSMSIALTAPTVPPPPPPIPAQIVLRGWGRGAEVFLDGNPLGRVAADGTFARSIPPGDHEIKVVDKRGKSGTTRRYFASSESAALAKQDFVVEPPPPPPPPPPPEEEKDWIQVKDSGSIEELEKFRVRYPNGIHLGEVETRIDGLSWDRAKQANSIEEYGRYLNELPEGKHREEAKDGIDNLAWNAAEQSNTVQAFQGYVAQHSQGKHVEEAKKVIETLRFQKASSSEDEALLEAFLRDYPSSGRHAQIYRHLDDVVWQKTTKSDVSGLQSYCARFPDGRHLSEAYADIDRLTHEKPNRDRDKDAVLEVIDRYNRAYNDRNVDELRNVWPSMDKKQIAHQRDFFRTASSVSSTYRVVEDPQIKGDEATVKFTQVVEYVVQGRRETPLSPGTRIVQLRRIPSGPSTLGVWKIESMSQN